MLQFDQAYATSLYLCISSFWVTIVVFIIRAKREVVNFLPEDSNTFHECKNYSKQF